MDKTTRLPGRRIILFGQQNLQNSILIGFIHQRTNIDCQLVNHLSWNHQWNEYPCETLALIDSDAGRLERVQDLLEQIHEQPFNPHVALFNVPHQDPLERMIAWPNVNGLFYRDTSQQQLSKGIVGVFSGECWLPRQLMANYLSRHRHKPKRMSPCASKLTKREKQILQLTATGATNTEIADQLNVSMHTVKTHIYNLFKKIGASNRIQAVNWAQENMDELLRDRA
ncbi:transcriptional regulator CsgD [Bacterioplanes sanyensis]|uniref:LuxR C-terminal-related transcriptional regulator n=1 Tax=Bacterioplanes sanyensis TaxID=1249553 RepID=UPI001676A7FD|nr:LuxR C-terminal-related transcriptional regulator [Bacterioplanes sanyensis]GGY46607.1 transcriptional regulator CsgD [Bacterioplanes sanyensis]